MHYLDEAALFLILPIVLILLGWWNGDSRATKLENSILTGAVLLGLFGLLIWLWGLTANFQDGVWWWFFWLCFLVAQHGMFFEQVARVREHARAMIQVWRILRPFDALLGAYLFLACGLTLVLCLAPPSGNDYDSLMYHLAVPRQYLLADRIVELPYDHHSYFPFTLEMLFLAAQQLRPDLLEGAVLAKLFHWLMLPLTCAALVAIGQRHLNLRIGLLAACLFASLPVVLNEATTAYIDLGLAAWTVLAFATFANWLHTREAFWLGWSGVFCGFGLGTKYLGALLFGWLLLWLVMDGLRSKTKLRVPLLRFAGFALLLGSGWYLRNWMWTGNPVYPFAYEIFGGKGWTLAMAQAYALDQAKFGFGRSLSDFLWLPWRVAMTPLNAAVLPGNQTVGLPFWPFLPTPRLGVPQSGIFEVGGLVTTTIVGPALLAFGAPLFAIKRPPPVVKFFAISFVFFWLFWFATGQYVRYLLPSFALLCVPCAWVVSEFCKRGAILKWTTSSALLLWFAFVIALLWSNAQSTLNVVLGRESAQSYLSRTFAAYDAQNWANLNTPRDARFAIWGEARNYYLDRSYFWADNPHNNLIDYDKVRSGEDLIRELKRLGATHVFWNSDFENNGGFGTPPPQWNQAIQKGLAIQLFSAKGYAVFSLNDATAKATS